MADALTAPVAATPARADGALRETAALVAVWGTAALIAGVFLWILGELVWNGVGALSWEYLTSAPREAGRAGGIAPILVSTLAILGVCLAATVPIAFGSAVFLAEYTSDAGRFGRVVRTSLDVLAGVPSIVFGLFGNAFFCRTLGLGFSILSGGLTLACMALPLVIRSTEEGLRAVPREYRMGAAALALSRTTTLFRLLLPAAVPGLTAGLVLGIGRALAETAALIFTSGYVDRMPSSLLDSGRALSIHVYDLSMNVAGGDRNAYASALVLVGLLLLVNGVAGALSALWRRRLAAP
ncbi:MAG: phosphate ABC transporter permease PstA [Myxococcales bacterium]|nr:phosphate ABC transporter permease PstA [Myxococcales bacterium]